MDFSNSFTVEAPLARVWGTLTDPHQVTPCVPGAQITEMIDDTHFNGTVKVKLGAVQMSYRGTMEMQPDEAAHTIVLSGKGTATSGGGGATGTVTVKLAESDGGTAVEILAQVDVTGRVAQFGRGIMQDVSNRLIKEFASCLQQRLSSTGEPETAAAGSGTATESPGTIEPQPGSPSSPAAATAPAATSATAAPASLSSGAQTTELKLSTLLVDITRTRVAAGLRLLASRIEPK